MLPTKEIIEQDLKRYCKAMAEYNGWQTCAAIEQKYDMYGYTPQIVTGALSAGARGEDMADWIDRQFAEG